MPEYLTKQSWSFFAVYIAFHPPPEQLGCLPSKEHHQETREIVALMHNFSVGLFFHQLSRIGYEPTAYGKYTKLATDSGVALNPE